MIPLKLAAVSAGLALGLGLMACNSGSGTGTETGPPDSELLPKEPEGFPKIPYPPGNPLTSAKIELGRRLFYDPRLSRNGTISCGSCHKQEHAFTDAGKSFSLGIDRQSTLRNSPSIANSAYNTFFMAEGGVPTLELQAIAPIINPLEMDMNTDSIIGRIDGVGLYRELFRQAWGDDSITFARVTKAIASFERTLVSGASPYDRWLNGDARALSESATRGVNLFFGEKGDCFHCHGGFNFTDQSFHNTGLDSVTTDPGRIAVTDRPLDDGKFKTPSLRNIALTAPYMHDGRFSTLRETLEHYNSGGKNHPNQDPLVRPMGLSEGDIADLIAFLEALTDTAFTTNPDFGNPWLP